VASCEMEFCLLGPLMVRSRGIVLPAIPGKQRALLAALLLSPNRTVSLDELTEAIWGDDPPASATAAIRNYVKALRKALTGSAAARIATVPGGYAIRVATGELDVASFADLYEAGRVHVDAGAWREAAGVLREALSLWRGEPLADVPSQWLAWREVPRLAELRLRALEARCEADLQLGWHGDVIVDLRQMIALHPLRERLHALLMLALYRDGRQGEALAAYQHVRAVLVEDLGSEPGPDLRKLQQQILAGDPAMTGSGSLAAVAPPAGKAVPRELPALVRQFTGRSAELAELSRLASGAGGCALVICAVNGTAGVGKTALAVQWAHQAADRFPDGQLYVNLRGYDPDRPMAAADALAGFLRALGVPGQEIPDKVEDRSRLYRSRLAGRRMLVLLDNARDSGQVRPLLPGDPGCVTVVTSRDALAGLVATDGAMRLELNVLPVADSVTLLRALIGSRADEDPAAAEELARLCAQLPLALRIASEQAAARQPAPLSDLVAELAASRLDMLDAGEARADVRVVFSWSCRQLSADVAQCFALTGLHPGTDLDADAAAALVGTSIGQARKALRRLHRASLIQPTGPGRYGMHDLLRAYAREVAATVDTEATRRSALTRLFDHYLLTADAAMDALHPEDKGRRGTISVSDATARHVPERSAARAWLDRERANLVATTAHAADHGWPSYATQMAMVLWRYLESDGHYPELLVLYGCALRAVQLTGDRRVEAELLNNVTVVYLRQGRYEQAAGYLGRSLALHRDAGNRAGEAYALGNLGITQFLLGEYQRAAGHHREALAAYRETGNETGETRTLLNLSLIDLRQGRYLQAAEQLEAALALCRKTGNRFTQILVLANLGLAELRQGQLPQARERLRQALTEAGEHGGPAREIYVLTCLGVAELGEGEPLQAQQHLEQALALCRQSGDKSGEIEALNALGQVFLATNRPDQGRLQHGAALTMARDAGGKYEQAQAHHGLGLAHGATRDWAEARRHWQLALKLYTELGTPEAQQVQKLLVTARGEQKAQAMISQRLGGLALAVDPDADESA
jgi:DNA-binding SARP family transcriptional activator/Tfp pilus assembly protein PilF